MKPLALVALLVLIALAVLATLAKRPKKKPAAERPTAKQLLSNREQVMFNRLRESFPSLTVLAQVSFGALLTARAIGARNTFANKIADFVICDRAFQVLASIELDDRSHDGKREKDRERDQMLTNAGYTVLRYPNVPDVADLQRDLDQALEKRKLMSEAPEQRGTPHGPTPRSRRASQRR